MQHFITIIRTDKYTDSKNVSGKKLGFLILLLVIYCTGSPASKKYLLKGETGVSESRFPLIENAPQNPFIQF